MLQNRTRGTDNSLSRNYGIEIEKIEKLLVESETVKNQKLVWGGDFDEKAQQLKQTSTAGIEKRDQRFESANKKFVG